MHPTMYLTDGEAPQHEAEYYGPSPSIWDTVDPIIEKYVKAQAEADRRAAETAALPPQRFAGTSYRYAEYFAPPEAPIVAVVDPALTGGASPSVLVGDDNTVTVTGLPTGGTFRLQVGGRVTAPIPHNASLDDVRLAMAEADSRKGYTLEDLEALRSEKWNRNTFTLRMEEGLGRPIYDSIMLAMGSWPQRVIVVETDNPCIVLGGQDA
jgi:hypothetical protein